MTAVVAPDIRYFNLPNLPHVDPRAFGAKFDGTTDDLGAINLALAACSADRPVLTLPGRITKWSGKPTFPALDGLRIVGNSRYGTIIDLRTSTTGGLVWDGSARREGIILENLTIQGKLTVVTNLTNANPGTNTQVSTVTYPFVGGETLYIISGTNVIAGYYTVSSVAAGVATLNTAYATGASTNGTAYIYPGAYIGLDFNEVDESRLVDVAITGWDTGMRTKTNVFGAYFNKIDHPRVVNCGRGLYFTGSQGANRCHVSGGHLDVNGIAILVDTPSDGLHLEGVGFQANAEAIQTAGKRGFFNGITLEGNNHDITFLAASADNVLDGGFYDDTKIADLSTTKSNHYRGFGRATTETLVVPQGIMSYDWRLVTNTSKVIGVQFGCVGHRFQIVEGRFVSSMSFEVAVSAGNVDCAVVDAVSAEIVASSGPVALGSANAKQTVNFSKAGFLYPGGTFYMCVLFDDATAALMGFTLDTPAQIMSAVDKLVTKKTMANGTASGQNLISGASTSNIMYAIEVA